MFHNAKFDIAFFEYHFGFNFPRFEDTMLMHYMLDEQPGTHGLKQLTLKHTPYGDYEKPMYQWIEDYRKRTGILKDSLASAAYQTSSESSSSQLTAEKLDFY